MEPLDNAAIKQFIEEGYVKIEQAFPSALADQCRSILWKATGCDPENPETWTQPVIRIGEMGMEPFRQAANTEILHGAFDQLVGKGNWLPRFSLGSFPIRFPNQQPSNDTGFHVDASFPGDDANHFLEWRINIHSKGRALLMLFLFSDVGELDAPTRIKVGSHQEVARILKPAGERGLSFMELACYLDSIPSKEMALATGKAGTVYLCHPFIVHAAQEHKGKQPKFMAQPPLHFKNPINIFETNSEFSPVIQAILNSI